MKYGIIANPVSGKLSLDKKKKMLEYLADYLGDCKLFGLDTKSVEEFHNCINDVSKKVDVAIIAGGDGTFLDALNSVDKDATLSYLPFGSGNAIKYAFGLAKTRPEIIEQIKNGKKRSLDLILCNNEKKTLFADVGIAGLIMKERDRKQEKGYNGKLAYSLAAAKAIVKHKNRRATMNIDGQIFEFRKMVNLIFTKTPYQGYGMKLVPQAKMDDGLIHCIAAEFNPAELVYGTLTSFLGGNKAGIYLTGKDITVDTEENEYMDLAGDFEKIGKNFSFRILPKELKLVC